MSERWRWTCCTLLAASAPAWTATWHVPAQHPTIQEAIDAAAAGDTVLVAPGRYTPADPEGISFHGKAIAVLGRDGAQTTVVDAGGAGRGFRFDSGEGAGALLSGFTITGGPADDCGGVLCLGSSPTLRRLWIAGNVVEGDSHVGGGLRLESSAPTVDSCRIAGNRTLGDDGHGGGIYARDSCGLFRDCAITGNLATSPGAHGGGLFLSRSSPTFERCVIDSNQAYSGGGMHLGESSPRFDDCSIRANTASKAGGVRSRQLSMPRFSRCVIADNEASSFGGGAFNCDAGGELLLIDCVISGNRAALKGGALRLRGTRASLRACRVVDNRSATEGGGIAAIDQAEVELKNCVVAGNRARGGGGAIHAAGTDTIALWSCTLHENVAGGAGGALLCGGGAVILRNCLLWDDRPEEIGLESGSISATWCDIEGSWEGTGNIDVDPLLAPGPRRLPRPASPCVDAGDPALRDGVYDADPRWPAFFPNAARCDIGAYGGPDNRLWIR